MDMIQDNTRIRFRILMNVPVTPRRYSLVIGGLVADKVFFKSFCRCHLPHKSVNFSFPITDTTSQLTDLSGIEPLHIDFRNTLCETRSVKVTASTSACLRTHEHVYSCTCTYTSTNTRYKGILLIPRRPPFPGQPHDLGIVLM